MKDLRVLRAQRRLSQQDVADAIGIQRTAYNRIENNLSVPKVTTAQKLADLFEISLDELLRG